MSVEISVVNNVSELVERIDALAEQLDEQETTQLVDMFNAVKTLNKASDSFQKQAREVIINRRSEGGTSDKGHFLMMGRETGVKVVPSNRYTVKEGAYEYLVEKGMDDIVPRIVDFNKALEVLKRLGVDEVAYTAPTVTREFIEGLVATKQLTASDVPELIEVTETFSLR